MSKLVTSLKLAATLALALVAIQANALADEPAPRQLLEAKTVSLSDFETAAATDPVIRGFVDFVKVSAGATSSSDPALKSRALAALESAILESISPDETHTESGMSL